MFNNVDNQQKPSGSGTGVKGLLLRAMDRAENTQSGQVIETENQLNEQGCDTLTVEGAPVKPSVERPKNFINYFQNDNGLCSRLHNQLNGVFNRYFKGSADEETVIRTVDQAVSSLVECYGNLGFDPADITDDVIRDTYELCRCYIVSGAWEASVDEGRQVRQLLHADNSPCMYYNADFYYQSENMIDKLYSHMQALAVKYDCGALEMERDYPKDDIRNQFYASYTSYVNSSMRQFCGNIIDESVPPPEGFRMFFTTNGAGMMQYPASMGLPTSMDSTFDGGVYIQYKDWSFAHRVPIRKDPTRFPVSVNLMDVIKKSGKNYPKEIRSFLGNFDFFATNVGKLYTDVHERKY